MAMAVAFVLDQVIGQSVPAAWEEDTLPGSDWSIDRRTRSVINVGSGGGTARANQPRSSGKVYFELEVVSLGSDLRVGFCRTGHLSSAVLGDTDESVGWDAVDERVYFDGAHETYGSGIGSGFSRRHVLAVAVDLDSGDWWLGYDGVWFDAGDPATNTNPSPIALGAGPWRIACTLADNASVRLGGQVTARPPAGFAAGWTEAPELAAGIFVSTVPFTTSASDTPAHTHFAGRLKADSLPQTVRGVRLRQWSGPRRESGAGVLDLINTDGFFDALGDDQVRDRVGKFYEGDTATAFESWNLVADSIADRIDNPDDRTARLTLRDRGAVFEVQVQGTQYGAEIDNTALVNQSRPLAIGSPLSCPVPLEQPGDLIFGCHESPPHAVVRVRDQGVEVPTPSGWVPAQNGFEKLDEVFGQIVADIDGAKTVDGDLVTRLPDVLAYLLSRRGLSTDMLDATTINALDAACPYPISRWIDPGSPVLLADLLTDILDSFCGAWWIDRFGKLRVGRLYDPEPETPVLELTSSDVALSELRRELDRAASLSTVWLGGRNWYTHRAAELADDVLTAQIGQDLQQDYRIRVTAATTPHAVYQHAIGAAGDKPNGKGMATLFNTTEHVQAIADHTLALYAQPRFFVRVPIFNRAIRQLEPFQCVRLAVPRYGFDAGRNMILLRPSFRSTSARSEALLWT